MYSLRDRWIDIFNQRYPELDTLLEGVNAESERRKIAYRFLVGLRRADACHQWISFSDAFDKIVFAKSREAVP